MRATDSTYYNIKRLHVVFAAASLAMLAATVWMLAADHWREWKAYQRTFRQSIEPWMAESTSISVGTEEASPDDATHAESAASRSLAIEQIWLPDLTINYNFRQVPRFDRCTTCHQGMEKTRSGATEPAYLPEQFLTVQLPTPKASPQSDGEAAPTLAHVYGFSLTRGMLDDRTATVASILPKSAAATAKLAVGDAIVSIDGSQTANRSNVEAALLNRTEWGKPAALEIRRGLPHPYQSHPRVDLFVGSASPHPMAEFGCTVCHDGQGSATQFKFASHSPNDPDQRSRWRREHGWFWNHDWEFPMRPARFAESNCLKCHHDVTDLEPSARFADPPAAKLMAGYHLVRQNGCFGCHEINGVGPTADRLGPDMRLEPRGTFRKVGPSLRDVAGKLNAAFVEAFVAAPAEYRPESRMPQFFGLHEHLDGETLEETRRFEAVELQAIAEYLLAASQPVPPLPNPAEVTEPPSPERGKRLFLVQGCAACHKHRDFPASQSTQGPDLSRLGAKFKTPRSAAWLVDWIRDPVRHAPRTVMPNMLLRPIPLTAPTAEKNTNERSSKRRFTDPAADIAAYLLASSDWQPSQRSAEQSFKKLDKNSDGKVDIGEYMADRPFKSKAKAEECFGKMDTDKDGVLGLDEFKASWTKADAEDIDALVRLYLGKALPATEVQSCLQDGIPASLADQVGGDVKELASPINWDKKLRYVGRATIRKRGCFGCHDIPGFEDSQPIGPPLSDWGRKQQSQLAFEQVAAHLALAPQATPAFYQEAILARRREGFLWQKLAAPRSFDFIKAKDKTFNEQLLMGRFRMTETERESIMTFVLGLVAEPAGKFVYQPDPRRKAIAEGRKVLDAHGCVQCHTMEMERWTIEYDPDAFPSPPPVADYDFLKPVVSARAMQASKKTDFRGLARAELVGMPQWNAEGQPEEAEDDDGNPLYVFINWEPAVIAGNVWPVGGAGILVSPGQIVSKRPPRGGDFARMLYPVALAEAKADGSTAGVVEAWGWVPPPLEHEGRVVRPTWLQQYLLSPSVIRPAAALRMPKFNLSAAEAAKLADYFAAAAGADFPYPGNSNLPPVQAADEPQQDSRRAKAMRFLVDRTTYCAKCHLIGDYGPGGESKTVLAPRLDLVAARIRPEYLRRWLANPKSVLPYTAMPVNFPSDKQMGQEIYAGASTEQLDAVMDLLVHYDDYVKRRVSALKLVEP